LTPLLSTWSVPSTTPVLAQPGAWSNCSPTGIREDSIELLIDALPPATVRCNRERLVDGEVALD
jgi:hypothetical protein